MTPLSPSPSCSAGDFGRKGEKEGRKRRSWEELKKGGVENGCVCRVLGRKEGEDSIIV